MKVAVLSFWHSNSNYGQLLQAYALQTYLLKQGHDAFLIKYKFKKRKRERTWLRKARSRIGDYMSRTPFDSFRKKLRFSKNYWNYEDLIRQPPRADAYIVGSDQVWNYDFVTPIEPFFLKFGDNNVTRISYAASFGQETIPDNFKEIYSEHMRAFDAISVRETSGLQLCHELGFPQAQHVLDPVFLLEQQDWDELCQSAAIKTQGRANCFIYTINSRETPLLEPVENSLERSERLRYEKLTTHKNDIANQKLDVGGWLKKIQSAELVVTNSFHATAFCIIFKTNFITLLATGREAGMNKRLFSLLESVGLQDRLLQSIDDLDDQIDATIDWQAVESKISTLKKDSEGFLEMNLHRRPENP